MAGPKSENVDPAADEALHQEAVVTAEAVRKVHDDLTRLLDKAIKAHGPQVATTAAVLAAAAALSKAPDSPKRELGDVFLKHSGLDARATEARVKTGNQEPVTLAAKASAKQLNATLELVNLEGPTSVFVDASIGENGDLVFSGQDVGEAPKKFFGDNDYEYWLTIRAEHKDAMLLALLEQLYKDDARVVSRLKELLDVKGVPCEFTNYA
jgi:hypothetical protein